MKKIIVTGGAGFIGSEFVRQALRKKYKIIVLDSISYAGDKKRLHDVADDIIFHKISINNAAAVNRIFKKEKPDIIVHFAAETHVDRSILDGQVFLKTNVLGTQVLLEAARFHNGTLIFSGFGPVRRTYLGSVPKTTPEERERFLQKVRRLGEKGC
jgi:dTDP-glucose 4,6-dehydratase